MSVGTPHYEVTGETSDPERCCYCGSLTIGEDGRGRRRCSEPRCGILQPSRHAHVAAVEPVAGHIECAVCAARLRAPE